MISHPATVGNSTVRTLLLQTFGVASSIAELTDVVFTLNPNQGDAAKFKKISEATSNYVVQNYRGETTCRSPRSTPEKKKKSKNKNKKKVK